VPELIQHILALWATLYTLVYPSVVLARSGYLWLRARRAVGRTVRIPHARHKYLLECEAALRVLNALRAETAAGVSNPGKLASGGQD
jgi:hypothetical protein